MFSLEKKLCELSNLLLNNSSDHSLGAQQPAVPPRGEAWLEARVGVERRGGDMEHVGRGGHRARGLLEVQGRHAAAPQLREAAADGRPRSRISPLQQASLHVLQRRGLIITHSGPNNACLLF